MNILAVFFHFPPISGGGVIVAVEIVNTLASMGHNVTVLTPNVKWDGPKFEPKINSKVKVIRVDVPSQDNLKVAARRCKNPLKNKGIELCNKTKFDFIFTIFHPFHFAPNAAVGISKKVKIPTIVKIDDAIYEKASGIKSIQRKIEQMISSKTLKNAAKVLVANTDTQKIITDFYGVSDKKITIIPNGINTDLFYNNSNSKSKSILFSGVMYDHRGLDILLKAAPTVIKKIPDVKFLLFGEGPKLDELQKFAKEKDIETNVEFRGWIEREELVKQLADAAIGIGPLKSTTVTKNALPIKVLEYMASSLPILTLKHTLPYDVLEDGGNGYFVNNEEDLAAKIIELLENEETRTKMGLRSREIALTFDWHKVVSNILNEYEKLEN